MWLWDRVSCAFTYAAILTEVEFIFFQHLNMSSDCLLASMFSGGKKKLLILLRISCKDLILSCCFQDSLSVTFNSLITMPLGVGFFEFTYLEFIDLKQLHIFYQIWEIIRQLFPQIAFYPLPPFLLGYPLCKNWYA